MSKMALAPYSLPFNITITNEALKTFFTGAMGAVTFGSYSQYQNMEAIKLNNQNQAEIMRLNNLIQEQKLKELKDELDTIKNYQKSRFW